MRLLAAAAVSALAVASAAAAAYRPSPLLPLDGAYRLSDRTVVSLAVTPDGSLLYTDTRTGNLRQLSPAGARRFSFGPAYLVQHPTIGTIAVKGTTLTLTTNGRTRTGRLVPVRRARVVFRGAGVRLVGKVTSPTTPGRHPAIAIVHGSDAADRDAFDLLVNFYSSLGYVVLTYDKRGVGDSGGTYQEFPSTANVHIWRAMPSAPCARWRPGTTSTRAGSALSGGARPAGSSRARRRSRSSSTSR
jgi:dipeptidyl aminopeptidase/acylaminoacyl peptidase